MTRQAILFCKIFAVALFFQTAIVLPSFGQKAGTPPPETKPIPIGITFEYDATGNRVNKIILFEVLNPIKSESKSDINEISNDDKVFDESLASSDPFVDAIGERKILIYPNPTRGNLKVEFTGANGTEQPYVQLYSITGSLIYSSRATNNLVQVDLSDQPNGTYILNVIEGSLSTTWKIIKQ